MVTNVEMDHHSRWGSVAELRARLRRVRCAGQGAALPADGGLDASPRAASRRLRRRAPGPAELELAVPGRHNVLNARAALAAVELAGFDARRRRRARSPTSPGCAAGSS